MSALSLLPSVIVDDREAGMENSGDNMLPADLVIVSGAVFTGCQDRPISGGVAVVRPGPVCGAAAAAPGGMNA